MKTCQHCHKFKATRPRGLCWGCHAKLDIRNLYPVSIHPGAIRNGIGVANVRAKPPKRPTDFPAGSPEKIKVMHERAKRGEALFHEGDCRVIRVDV